MQPTYGVEDGIDPRPHRRKGSAFFTAPTPTLLIKKLKNVALFFGKDNVCLIARKKEFS